MKKIVCLALMIGVLVPVAAWGATPMDALRGPIESGIALLRDPQYADQSKKDEQRHRMWEIVRQAFDFRLIAARALGRNWQQFSPAQKEAFTEAFAALLGNTYIGKIQGEFSDEKVEFLQEEMVSDNKAVIKTRILRKNAEIPVDYNMLWRDDQWRIYDVKVEGIGLVLNYRKQFKSFLSKETGTPDSLIETLREKADQ
ncbi:MAG: ABC transporter substrate-binding protein [Desulfobacterales bacterium]|nr:ABC transporter substrate-binding protein [Desulfobacterales bacterium]